MAKTFIRVLLASAMFVGAAQAEATVYAGSWQVDAGPNWTTVPTAYSGVEAAALLFGGSPSDYVISTVGTDLGTINDMAWVSTFGGACDDAFPCGTQVADTFVQSTGGLYADLGDTSAYVQDWALGEQYTNYAFRIDHEGDHGGDHPAVPEPATWAMMLLGFGAIGWQLRRRRSSLALAQAA